MKGTYRTAIPYIYVKCADNTPPEDVEELTERLTRINGITGVLPTSPVDFRIGPISEYSDAYVSVVSLLQDTYGLKPL